MASKSMSTIKKMTFRLKKFKLERPKFSESKTRKKNRTIRKKKAAGKAAVKVAEAKAIAGEAAEKLEIKV